MWISGESYSPNFLGSTNLASGLVYYARTFNWSSTSVETGSKIITTEFVLPQNLAAGSYSLVAVANGNPSF